MKSNSKRAAKLIDLFLGGTQNTRDIPQYTWSRIQDLALDLEEYCQRTDKVLRLSTRTFVTLAQCAYNNVPPGSRFIAASRVLATAHNLRIKGAKNLVELFERIQGK